MRWLHQCFAAGDQPHLLGKYPFGPHLRLYFIHVIEVIGKGRMHITERESRNLRDNFVRSL